MVHGRVRAGAFCTCTRCCHTLWFAFSTHLTPPLSVVFSFCLLSLCLFVTLSDHTLTLSSLQRHTNTGAQSWVLPAACWVVWTARAVEGTAWVEAAGAVVVVAAATVAALATAVVAALAEACLVAAAACRIVSSAAPGSGSRQTPTCRRWAALLGDGTCRGGVVVGG